MFSKNDCLGKLNSQWYLLFMISEWNKGTVKRTGLSFEMHSLKADVGIY